ncbi:vasoactive intestinal polypeptide receptor 2-like [Engraulis encrasicolus]|uniref:vasoactive intestinal polypeptide receptor 2-like n=1 Tax=Engraulis encrasicolus TaxID=184585 RepID=UPI002FD5FBFD
MKKASASHPRCNFHQALRREEEKCRTLLTAEEEEERRSEGSGGVRCKGFWDRLMCWGQSEVNATVTIPCPDILKELFHTHGVISRNCSPDGAWSDVFPNISTACGTTPHKEKLVFFLVVRVLYSLGHALSLVALTTSVAILCSFRRLRCTRNYIHLNLFISFMLRAVSVLIKDHLIFTHTQTAHCNPTGSLVGCRLSLVLCQYCIMGNFLWLLVEGLYLHALLTLQTHTHLTHYLLIGWAIPAVFVAAWTIARLYLEDTGCWERNDSTLPGWLINGPITLSIIVNFVLFLHIVRILLQKLRCPGADQSQYRRLAKSTLLLIPLFGIHYVLFVSLNESVADYKILFDLGIGSFQGLVVAILYCFLNSEVQAELKRKWHSLCFLFMSRPHHPHHRQPSLSLSQNASVRTTVL